MGNVIPNVAAPAVILPSQVVESLHNLQEQVTKHCFVLVVVESRMFL